MSAPDLMAIISKAVFEKQAPGSAPGKVIPIDRYNSENKALDPLGQGGRLFLFTVRPPEQLWLVAVLENLEKSKGAWVAAQPNRAPVTDISGLRSKIKFESGKGITAKPGSLGMSLQTPRALAADDVTLLLGAMGGAPAAAGTAAAAPAPPAPRIAPGPPPPPPVLPRPAKLDHGGQLLFGVLEAPEELPPRLVYADWLQEKGDPRGEFIHVQCMLGGAIEYPAQRGELRVREAELLEEHRQLWSAPARGLDDWVFRRGFIDEVRTKARTFLPAAEGLFAVEPVLRLSLEGAGKKECAALAAAPWLARVRRLRLRGELGDDGIKALAASPNLAWMSNLNLGSNDIEARGASALAASAMRACRSLSLSGNPIGDAGAADLLASPVLQGCRRLYLARCELSGRSAVRLAGADVLAELTGLCLGGNDIDDAGGLALAASPVLGNLKRLELDGGSLGKKARAALKKRFGDALRIEEGYGGGYGDDED